MNESPDDPETFTESRPGRDNVAALTGVQVFRFAAGIGVSVLLARWLGREGWGAYTFVVTVVQVLAFAANAGIHQLLPRDVARQPAAASSALGSALRTTALCSLLALVPILIYVGWRDPALAGAAAVCGVALGLESLVNVYKAAFEGLRRMGLQLAGVAAGRATYLVATAVAVVLGWPLAAIFGAHVLAFAVTLVWFASTWRRHVGPARTGAPTRSLLRRAAPFAAFVAFAAVQERVDVLFVEALRGDDAVGVYRGATLLLINLPVAARILSTAAYPRLAAAASDPNAFSAVFGRVIRLLLAGGLALGVGGWMVGAPLVEAVLGAEYASSGALFAWAAAVLPVVFVRTGLGMALSATDLERPRARGMAIAAAINVGLNALVVPTWGVEGAIATTIVSETALLVLYAAPLRARLQQIRLAAIALRCAVPAIALAAALAVPGPLALRFALGVVVWALAAAMAGAALFEDVAEVRRL